MEGMCRLKTFALILLTISLFCFFSPSGAWGKDNNKDKDDDEFRVRIYIAVGGACAGVVWFIAYSSGLEVVDPVNRSALFNYSKNSWKTGLPLPKMVETGSRRGDLYLNIINIRF